MSIGAAKVGAYNTFTAATNNNVPFPAGIAPGDFVVLGYNIQAAGIPSLPTSAHALWTSLAAFGGTGSTLLPALRFALYGPAVGDESGTNANVVHASGAGSSGQMVGFAGVDQITPQDVSIVLFTAGAVDSSAGAQAHCIIPGFTLVSNGVTLVSWVASNTAAQTVTPATIGAGTFTETGDGPGSGATGEMAYLQGVPLGATGSADFLFSGTGKQIGVMVALRPAASVPNTGGNAEEPTRRRRPIPRDDRSGAVSAAFKIASSSSGRKGAVGVVSLSVPAFTTSATGVGDQAARRRRQDEDLLISGHL